MELEIVNEKPEKAVAKRKTTAPVESTADAIIRMAVEKNLDVDKLERLIEMRNREEERIARQEFTAHFTAMQSEFPMVQKHKKVYNKTGDKVLYRYASLEDILAEYAPILARHGFAYRWEEEAVADNIKRVWCIISGYGHEERSYVDIPIEPGNSFTNNIQQRGVSTSYGKRYSFINATGVILAGEDNEQDLLDNLALYDPYIKQIKETQSINELKKVFEKVYTELTGDQHGRALVLVAKDEMKKELLKKELEDGTAN
jgi:hypothetical protein